MYIICKVTFYRNILPSVLLTSIRQQNAVTLDSGYLN